MARQQSLIYSLVARGTVVLAEYTAFSGNFSTVALQCLQKLPTNCQDTNCTYTFDRHTFNYLVEEGFTYGVVAEKEYGRAIPFGFLERVKEDFKRRYGGGKAATAIAHSLDKQFGRKLKEHMQYYVDHSEEMSNYLKIKAQVSIVKGIFLECIEKVFDRGENLELLADKAEMLRFQADHFKRKGRQLQTSMCSRKMKVILFTIITAAVAFIIQRRQIFSATYSPPAPEPRANVPQMFFATYAPPAPEPQANDPTKSSRLMQVLHGEVPTMATLCHIYSLGLEKFSMLLNLTSTLKSFMNAVFDPNNWV